MNELHGDVLPRLRLHDLVDGDDVRVVQRRGGARLPSEASRLRLVAREGGGKHLECDLAAEFNVLGQIDLAHPARTE